MRACKVRGKAHSGSERQIVLKIDSKPIAACNPCAFPSDTQLGQITLWAEHRRNTLDCAPREFPPAQCG